MTFAKMRVNARLMVAGATVVLGLAVLAVNTVVETKSQALEAHNTRLRNLVETSVGIVQHYRQQETDSKLSREAA